jgi:glycosyltransferase involved in cell wall biosynthesis
MTPIRLLFVLTQPVRGGVEEVVLALLRRLDPHEFRLAVAAPRPLLDAFAPDLRGVRVDAEAIAPESPFDRRELGRLAAFIRRFAPDIVNPHLFRSTAVAAPLARLHGARVVETYHGREGWRRGLVRGSFLPDRLVARLVDRVIAVSEAARTFLVRGKGYPERKITVVPNGRDLSVYRPGVARDSARKELGLDRAVPLVGVVGRLEAQKGHGYLLQAWPEVVEEFPDARLLLVGEGSLRGELEARARTLGVAESIIFAGFRADIPRMLDAVDVVALPSLYEGMPLTAIEGSAMARPVVATAVDGTPEVVRDGRTGRLVPPADPGALSRALRDLLRDPETARRMGEAGRDWVLTRFDLERQVAATAHVYRHVARGDGRIATRAA